MAGTTHLLGDSCSSPALEGKGRGGGGAGEGEKGRRVRYRSPATGCTASRDRTL